MKIKKVAIAGAGFSGAVLAHELAKNGIQCDVFDSRDHIGGNCHTKRDPETQVLVHQYGAHIFHTSSLELWDYVNQFGKFERILHRVKAVTRRGAFGLPINLLTINQFFGKTFSPKQAREFIASLGDNSITTPVTFEDQALKFLGRDLYENFFRGYTIKQWGVDPKELPASILTRLPVRFSYEDSYYEDRYQGIPVDGYSSVIENMLKNENIRVILSQSIGKDHLQDYDHLFYSGPIDAYFQSALGNLRYRTLIFERFRDEGDFQGNSVVNYCDEQVPFTRITEHKHFAPWETHPGTVCFREYSKATEGNDIPYYPMRLVSDKNLLQEYVKLAEQTENVTFCGRLGTYRYLDMNVVISESRKLAEKCLNAIQNKEKLPTFSERP